MNYLSEASKIFIIYSYSVKTTTCLQCLSSFPNTDFNMNISDCWWKLSGEKIRNIWIIYFSIQNRINCDVKYCVILSTGYSVRERKSIRIF